MMYAVGIMALGASAVTAANPLGPGAGEWQVEAAADHGFVKEQWDDAFQYMKDNVGFSGCVLVAKDGALVYEGYNEDIGFNQAMPTYIWSSTKTLGAIITGRAVELGLDLDKPISEYGVKSPRKYDVTSRMILTQAIQDRAAAGAKWAYDGAGIKWINLLPQVIEKATGRTAKDIWENDFVEYLGLSPQFSWFLPGPSLTFATGAVATCRDMAKIGQYVLNYGEWPGAERIVSSQYMHDMVIPQKAADEKTYSSNCYGYLTWTYTKPDQDIYPGKCITPTGMDSDFENSNMCDGDFPKDINMIAGALGQITMQFPSQNMSVTHMGLTIPRGELWPHHIAARLTEATWCIGMPGDHCGWTADPTIRAVREATIAEKFNFATKGVRPDLTEDKNFIEAVHEFYSTFLYNPLKPIWMKNPFDIYNDVKNFFAASKYVLSGEALNYVLALSTSFL